MLPLTFHLWFFLFTSYSVGYFIRNKKKNRHYQYLKTWNHATIIILLFNITLSILSFNAIMLTSTIANYSYIFMSLTLLLKIHIISNVLNSVLLATFTTYIYWTYTTRRSSEMVIKIVQNRFVQRFRNGSVFATKAKVKGHNIVFCP